MSEPKNHHLLPKFYLSGFRHKELHASEDHSSDKSRWFVWVYDKEQGRIRRAGVKNLSTERHYYSADVPGGSRDARPEKALARVEDYAARVIRGLRCGSELRPEQEARLAVFFAVMKFRVSSYRPWSLSYVAQTRLT